MRAARWLSGLVFVAACSSPQSAPPAAPPVPTLRVVPMATPEELSILGRTTQLGGGKAGFTITINGEKVIENQLSEKQPRGRFRGKWKEHDVLAECVLTSEVQCAVSLDAPPDSLAPAPQPTDTPAPAATPAPKKKRKP